MTGRRISISIVVAAFLGCTALRAAEKLERLELKGSTEVDLPKPKRTINTDRRLNDQADRPTVESAPSAPARNDNSPLVTKKLLHEIDRQKNWIYMDPREAHFDRKTEEFMKGEKGTGLYDNRFMQSDDDRTMVQKFMERDRNRDDKDKEDNDKDSERSDRAREKDGFLPKRDEDELKENNAAVSGVPKAQFDTAIFRAGSSSDPFGGNPLDNKLQRNPFSDSPFTAQKARGMDQDDLRQKQVAHEKEFSDILQSRPGSTASFGKIDMLNPAADVGRLDLGGSAGGGRRADPYSIGGRGGPTTVTFTDGGSSSFGNRPELGARSFSDALPSFGAPKAGPSFAPAPMQVAPNRAMGSPPPISATVPMRKF
jgi:hypothetical protein